MSLPDTIQQVRATGLKVAAAYATAQGAVKTAKRVANTVCHTWQIDRMWAEHTYLAAAFLASENVLNVPGVRQQIRTGNVPQTNDSASNKGFQTSDWTWMPVKGVSRALQVRTIGTDLIEFRAPRVKDLEALRERVAEVETKMAEERVAIEVDWTPQTRTDIFAWEGAEWGYRSNRAARTFDSVVLPAETQAEIEGELQRFTESRERLLRLELPWRRGYLLTGPPGTGKTSLSLAIAGALGFNLATLPLTDIKSDGELSKAVSKLPPRTVLVIEDIDAYSVSNERDHNAAKDGDLSLSGLLNSLDGFETPEGLVTILTTNHVEKLDPALVRAGRMDRTFDLGYIEATELERLFVWFYEQHPPSPAPAHTGSVQMCPAEAAELFKQHLDDPEGGWEAVLNRVNGTLHIAA